MDEGDCVVTALAPSSSLPWLERDRGRERGRERERKREKEDNWLSSMKREREEKIGTKLAQTSKNNLSASTVRMQERQKKIKGYGCAALLHSLVTCESYTSM